MLLYWLFRIPCVAQGHAANCVAGKPSLGCKCNVLQLRTPSLREALRGVP